MIAFWVAAVVMALLSVAALTWPLWRRRGSLACEEDALHDIAVYRDQLAEVTREIDSGLLARAEAEAASLEIKRRLLRAAERREKVSPRAAGQPSKGLLALALAVVVPLAALTLYVAIGSPELGDAPLAARRTQMAEAGGQTARPAAPAVESEDATARVTLDEAIAALTRHLAVNPDDARGWLLLGRAYLTNERYEDAVAALRRANELLQGQPEVAAAFGEALVQAADGRVTDEAREIFARVSARDPRNPQARYFLGLRKAQAGDLPGALQDWVDLAALSPSDAPWLEQLTQQIGSLAAKIGVDPAKLAPRAEVLALTMPPPLPADAVAIANMPEAEREMAVRAMVDRLASRLEQNPNDLEGWLRLSRAYEVLGEKAKADQARARAHTLAPPSLR